MTYTLIANSSSVVRDSGSELCTIPPDPGNMDWQACTRRGCGGKGNTPNSHCRGSRLRRKLLNFLIKGLTITSTGNPALNGTYSVIPPYNHTINAMLTSPPSPMGLVFLLVLAKWRSST